MPEVDPKKAKQEADAARLQKTQDLVNKRTPKRTNAVTQPSNTPTNTQNPTVQQQPQQPAANLYEGAYQFLDQTATQAQQGQKELTAEEIQDAAAKINLKKPKQQQKMRDIQLMLEVEAAIKIADKQQTLDAEKKLTTPGATQPSFLEALKEYNAQSNTYYNQSDASKIEHIRYYQQWRKIYVDRKNEPNYAAKEKEYEQKLIAYNAANDALLQAQKQSPSNPAVIKIATQALTQSKAELELARKELETISAPVLLAYRLAKHAQDQIFRPRQYLNTLKIVAKEEDEKALYNTLLLVEQTENRLSDLDNSQRLFQASTESELKDWTEKGEFKAEYPSDTQLTDSFKKLNEILKPARENVKKLKGELVKLGATLREVIRAIEAQRSAIKDSEATLPTLSEDEQLKLKAKNEEALRILENAQYKLTNQIKKIDKEIKAFEKDLNQKFNEANTPLNKREQKTFLKNLYDTITLKNPTTKIGQDIKAHKKVAVAVTGSAVAGGISFAGAGFLGLGSVLAFPPALLLLIPAGVLATYYVTRGTAYGGTRFMMKIGDSWNAFFGNPFKSETDKDEFLIARVGGGAALTKTLSKEKGEEGEENVIGVAVHMGLWSTDEERFDEVLKFVGECMALGLVETDADGKKTLYITNIPTREHAKTKMTLLLIAAEFGIELTGPGMDREMSENEAKKYDALLEADGGSVKIQLDGKKEAYLDLHGMAGFTDEEKESKARFGLLSEALVDPQNPGAGRNIARATLLVGDEIEQKEKKNKENVEPNALSLGVKGHSSATATPIITPKTHTSPQPLHQQSHKKKIN